LTTLQHLPTDTVFESNGDEPALRNPLRVALIVHTFDPGGLERCIAILANRLDRDRFHPAIFCLNRSGSAADWVRRDDVPVIELHKRAGNDVRAIFRLAKALRAHEIDLVHSHNWGTLVETSAARRLAGVARHVHAEHGLELADLRLGAVKRTLRSAATRWALRQADAVIAVCRQVAQRLEQRCGFPARRVELIANGVEAQTDTQDSTSRERIRRSLGIPDDTWIVGSVGRLAPVKDFGTAIEALALIGQRGIEAHLLLVGDGPEREILLAKAEAAGVAAKIHFAGQQNEVGSYLAAMDLYVNSSLSEGMSLSILEAMASGLPLVVTDVGENAALVAGGEAPCGVVVPPGAAAPMADAIQRLLSDPDQRRRSGCRAAERFRRLHGAQNMVRRYEEVYASVALADAPANGGANRPACPSSRSQ